MKPNRQLTELKNIGKKIAGRLNTVGIFSEDDLRQIGAVGAHKMLREKYPDERLPVCYYLYAFAGALSDKHWDDIGSEKKRQLKESINQLPLNRG